MQEIALIALIPVDATGFPDVGEPMPLPSIDHVETECDDCGRACWIGPGQARFRAEQDADALCYFCLVASGVLSNAVTKSVNPGNDLRPRKLPSHCHCGQKVRVLWSGPIGAASRPALLVCRHDPPRCALRVEVPPEAVQKG